MTNLKLSFLLLICLTGTTLSQNNLSKYGALHRFELNNALFPNSKRADGHNYNGKHYPKDIHYNDSTVLAFIPDYFSFEDDIDIVFYFHGWYNNVDSALVQFKLIEQFYSSKRNAVLIMPEGPKNAPDSFGGNLEEAGSFKLLTDEIFTKLNETYSRKLFFKNIVLAGHSGAYRVISYILLHGGLTENISEVYLYDGLYADLEKYSYWLVNYRGRFINIFTPDGGTKSLSENLMLCLKAWSIPFAFIDSDNFTDKELMNERIIFIASKLNHNEVISSQEQFQRFLSTAR